MAQKDTLQELISLQFESLSGGASHISEPPSDHNRQLDLPTSSHNPDAHNLFSEPMDSMAADYGFDFSFGNETDSLSQFDLNSFFLNDSSLLDNDSDALHRPTSSCNQEDFLKYFSSNAGEISINTTFSSYITPDEIDKPFEKSFPVYRSES